LDIGHLKGKVLFGTPACALGKYIGFDAGRGRAVKENRRLKKVLRFGMRLPIGK
jgi:hypothetical protein